ncbi:transaldolase/EF-hand domain-containing protein [Rubripirellula obstinata]|uniref:Transaldolase/EF-hand domain-containing protein n=1 Tax=Rubripirellula obstinata TaxID=406547 RepID=A0A5B1CEV7_9BACT|nr:calmodulin [Rubripirellula obstinata]KAA1257874.1 transaldolase/EF-hand domain-containing protein [Rubripirellula obstinata]
MNGVRFYRPIGLAVMAVASLGFSPAFAADDRSPDKQITAAMLPVAVNNGMTTSPAFGIYRADGDSATRKLAGYETDASGQWMLPTVIAGSERDHVPLVLQTPHGNLLIRMSVLIDGLSPERATEKLLDEVIERAGVEQPIATESKPSDNTKEVTVTPSAYDRDSVLTKLERLVRATGVQTADREELNWMLDQWRPGPLWLIARDSVSPPSQLVEPLAAWMDLDRDGVLQNSEWQGLSERLKQLDSNRDRIVTLVEVQENFSKNMRTRRSTAPSLDWNLAWKSGGKSGGKSDGKSDGELDGELERNRPAISESQTGDAELIDTVDAVVEVRSSGVFDQVASVVDQMLDTTIAKTLGSQVSVHVESGSVSEIPGGVQATFNNKSPRPAIRLTVHGYINKGLASVPSCQVSIAAKVAEHPIWSVIDANSDGRIVEVEQRNAANRIAALDCNQDGIVSPMEWPLAYHLVVCQGSDATEQLKSLTPRVVTTPINAAAVPVPDWFTGMDSNQDGSLTRGEFLGSTKQFSDYDQDNDGLLTPSETAIEQP